MIRGSRVHPKEHLQLVSLALLTWRRRWQWRDTSQYDKNQHQKVTWSPLVTWLGSAKVTCAMLIPPGSQDVPRHQRVGVAFGNNPRRPWGSSSWPWADLMTFGVQFCGTLCIWWAQAGEGPVRVDVCRGGLGVRAVTCDIPHLKTRCGRNPGTTTRTGWNHWGLGSCCNFPTITTEDMMSFTMIHEGSMLAMVTWGQWPVKPDILSLDGFKLDL